MKLQRGFSLVEMLVVITIIGILAAIAIPNMTRARNKARETEVKANLHVIQEAIERYAVDEGEYPRYLLGGSENSWAVFYTRDEGRGKEDEIYDPLIKFNYIDHYPKNPFVDEDKAAQVYLAGSGGDENIPASGDPRFGVKGTSMPNSVDDPLWISTGIGEYAETLNPAGNRLIGNYGVYGGYLNPRGEPTRYTIPGSFFYRAEGPIDMASSLPGTNPTRRDFQYQSFSRYILGGFGQELTKGLDILRLTGAGLYRHQPDTRFPYDIPLLLPEVFGGGEVDEDGNRLNPFFPYEPSQDGMEFYYGAPDGLEDGVIIVLTDSGDSLNF